MICKISFLYYSLSIQGQTHTMYPTSLLHLSRANPFSAPQFTLQKVHEPEPSHTVPAGGRRLAAAAVAGNNSLLILSKVDNVSSSRVVSCDAGVNVILTFDLAFQQEEIGVM